MTAKEYLSQIRFLNIKILQLQEQYREIKSISDGIGSIDYTRDYINSSRGTTDANYVGILSRLEALALEVSQTALKYVEQKNQAIKMIHELKNDRYITILFKKYAEFKDLEQVADEMGYTYQYIVEQHGKALKSFQGIHKDFLSVQGV